MDWTAQEAVASEGGDRLAPKPAAESTGGRPKGTADSEAEPVCITDNVVGVRSDAQLRQFLTDSRTGMAMVNYGSSWCSHCHAMLPAFLEVAKEYAGVSFAVAQVDYMQDLSGVTHTPTFAVYKRGSKVDQFFGANAQQLKDHVWLHTD